VADRLRLDDDAVAASRQVLADYGNCSSATVLLILDRIMEEGLTPGDHVVAMAFGPGLTLYAALLHVSEVR
jgi:alkylresorcinol/alkylpyrone synthase